MRITDKTEPEILESMACSEGLSLATNLTCHTLVLSTDCAGPALGHGKRYAGLGPILNKGPIYLPT